MKESRELSWDALKLALSVCPDAADIRIRYDSCTPHHVVAPLASFRKLVSLSAVCVTSGERPLTDFQDFQPALSGHGSTLTNLEFKV